VPENAHRYQKRKEMIFGFENIKKRSQSLNDGWFGSSPVFEPPTVNLTADTVVDT